MKYTGGRREDAEEQVEEHRKEQERQHALSRVSTMEGFHKVTRTPSSDE